MKNKIVNNVLQGQLQVFIVPNRAASVEDFLWDQDRIAYEMCEVADMNKGLFSSIYTRNDQLVELWWVGMGSENICDHGCEAESDDGWKYVFRPSNIQRLPAKMFEGRTEGDIIDMVLPIEVRGARKLATGGLERETKQIELHVSVKLNQTDFRYKRFGNFEDALAWVTR